MKKQLFLQKPLEDFIDFFEKLNPRSLDLLEKHCASYVAFKDSVAHIQGADDIQKVYALRFKLLSRLRYCVTAHRYDEERQYFILDWHGIYQKPAIGFILRRVPEPSKFGGQMCLYFDDEGLIERIEEKWDEISDFPINKYRRKLKRT